MASRRPPALQDSNSLNFATAGGRGRSAHVTIRQEARGAGGDTGFETGTGRSWSVENLSASKHVKLQMEMFVLTGVWAEPKSSPVRKIFIIWYMQLQMYQTFTFLKVIVRNRIYQHSWVGRAQTCISITDIKYICNAYL